jgi:hypothetical protein
VGITSLDGYVADADGRFDWAVPNEEVHAFINERERTIGTYVFGPRMYEEMAGWEADDPARDQCRRCATSRGCGARSTRSSTPGRW